MHKPLSNSFVAKNEGNEIFKVGYFVVAYCFWTFIKKAIILVQKIIQIDVTRCRYKLMTAHILNDFLKSSFLLMVLLFIVI